MGRVNFWLASVYPEVQQLPGHRVSGRGHYCWSPTPGVSDFWSQLQILPPGKERLQVVTWLWAWAMERPPSGKGEGHLVRWGACRWTEGRYKQGVWWWRRGGPWEISALGPPELATSPTMSHAIHLTVFESAFVQSISQALSLPFGVRGAIRLSQSNMATRYCHLGEMKAMEIRNMQRHFFLKKANISAVYTEKLFPKGSIL